MTGPKGGPAGRPRRLFAFDGSDYDVHPDGRIVAPPSARSAVLRVFRAGQSAGERRRSP